MSSSCECGFPYLAEDWICCGCGAIVGVIDVVVEAEIPKAKPEFKQLEKGNLRLNGVNYKVIEAKISRDNNMETAHTTGGTNLVYELGPPRMTFNFKIIVATMEQFRGIDHDPRVDFEFNEYKGKGYLSEVINRSASAETREYDITLEATDLEAEVKEDTTKEYPIKGLLTPNDVAIMEGYTDFDDYSNNFNIYKEKIEMLISDAESSVEYSLNRDTIEEKGVSRIKQLIFETYKREIYGTNEPKYLYDKLDVQSIDSPFAKSKIKTERVRD